MKLRAKDEVTLTVSDGSSPLLPFLFSTILLGGGAIQLVALREAIHAGAAVSIRDVQVAAAAACFLAALYLYYGIVRRALSPPRWRFDRAQGTVSIWGEVNPQIMEKFLISEVESVSVTSGAEALPIQVALLRRHRELQGKKPGLMLRVLERVERLLDASELQESNPVPGTRDMNFLCLTLKDGLSFLLRERRSQHRKKLEAQADLVKQFIRL